MPYQYKREPLSDDEVNRLTNACETFDEKFVIWTLLDTGLRVSEFTHLTKENIQWQERRLMIYGKGGPYGKKSKRRIIPMTDRVRRLIDHHFAEHDNMGMSIRTIQRIVKEVANKAGISKPVTPHVLRHTFSVNCIKKGISTRALMALLGHDRLTTTEIYLNLSPEDAIREFQNKW
ncbi:phage integrase family protein [Candidatus Shapirobacteria bacterium]|nr:phage integrase family protein [Candidatus Shapirobacteria bacterium]